MKKYFLYEFKKNALLLAGLTVILLLLHIPVLLTADTDYVFGAVRLYWISGLGGVLAAVLPIYLYSYKMKKRSLDLYYALPVPRKEIFSVKYIIGLILIILPYTVAYVVGAIISCTRCAQPLYTVYFIPQYFASLVGIYVIYSICVFLFTRANTILDGIATMLFGGFCLMYMALAVNSMLSSLAIPSLHYRPVLFPFAWMPYSLLDSVTTEFQQLIIHGRPYNASQYQLINASVSAAVFVVLAILGTYFAIRSERNTLAENAEQIAASPLSYKVMLPVYAACTVVIIGDLPAYLALLLPLTAVLIYLCAVLYKRTIKIGLKTALSLIGGGSVGAVILLFTVFF